MKPELIAFIVGVVIGLWVFVGVMRYGGRRAIKFYDKDLWSKRK